MDNCQFSQECKIHQSSLSHKLLYCSSLICLAELFQKYRQRWSFFWIYFAYCCQCRYYFYSLRDEIREERGENWKWENIGAPTSMCACLHKMRNSISSASSILISSPSAISISPVTTPLLFPTKGSVWIILQMCSYIQMVLITRLEKSKSYGVLLLACNTDSGAFTPTHMWTVCVLEKGRLIVCLAAWPSKVYIKERQNGGRRWSGWGKMKSACWFYWTSVEETDWNTLKSLRTQWHSLTRFPSADIGAT